MPSLLRDLSDHQEKCLLGASPNGLCARSTPDSREQRTKRVGLLSFGNSVVFSPQSLETCGVRHHDNASVHFTLSLFSPLRRTSHAGGSNEPSRTTSNPSSSPTSVHD